MKKATRLVIVDDSNTTMLETIFRKSGFALKKFDNAFDATSYIVDTNPEVVLIDIRMPVIDGFDMLKSLKERGVSTRIIMYSSIQIDTDTAVKCIKMGACDYISREQSSYSEIVKRVQRAILFEPFDLNYEKNLPPAVRNLIVETNRIDSLESKKVITEVSLKCVMLMTLALAIAFLKYYDVIHGGMDAIILFVVAQLLLLFPIGKVSEWAGRIGGFEAKIKATAPENDVDGKSNNE